jgi:hypothetical protein
MVGWDSSVGIVTRYMLEGPGIEYRWEAKFPAPVQTGSGAHPVFNAKGTGSFSVRVFDYPTPTRAEVNLLAPKFFKFF